MGQMVAPWLAAVVALLSPAAAVMNAGGVPYKVGNAGPEYSTEFADESPEYFDSYSEVQTRYSQVFWTRSPNIPLPADIVERFAGKVMVITGYEVDQVMNPHVVNGTCLTDLCKKSDLSVPIYSAYNHHYFGWLLGNHSEMYDLDEPVPGMNPTFSAVREKPTKPKNVSFPTNIVFKENPGGEYRKSYHGYPHGFGQLLYSPTYFVCEPMQIDTHNRQHNATEPTGYRPSFLPKSIDGRDGHVSGENLHSGLSPLIECPCTDRIYRSVKNSSAILTGGACKASIKTVAECQTAVELIAPVSGALSVHNASMSPGCTMRPTPAQGLGTYLAVFNSFGASKAACGTKGATAKGPFTWGAPTKGSMINCGGKGDAPCPKPNSAAGCGTNVTGVKTQCVWKSLEAAKAGCAKMDGCAAFFESSTFTLPKLAICPKGKKCPALFFARASASATKAAPTDMIYAKHFLHPAPADYVTGESLEALQGSSLVNISLTHDGKNASITLTGPSDVWFGVGWGATMMAQLPYAIVVDGTGKVSEHKLGPHRPGSVLASSVHVVSSKVVDGLRTVELSRAVTGQTKSHFSFPTKPGSIDLITAIGSGKQFAYHKARTGAKLTLLPTKVDSCLCAPITTEYLSYMNKSTAAFHYNCVEEPRGDMAHGQRDVNGKLLFNGKLKNPACAMKTYHGGLRCCHHEWYLTDVEQNSSIPLDQPDKNKDGLIPGIASIDTYYLKWRFYFQEYTPAPAAQPAASKAVAAAESGAAVAVLPSVQANASHTHLHHWVFLIDQQVNDYEEMQAEGGCDHGCKNSEGTITAHLQAKDMGLEDVPKNFTGITPLVMTPHCHAPSCLRQELWNADTNELICRAEAFYGTGNEVFNEKDYVAIAPCLWGYQPGLKKPITISPKTNLTAIKYFNNTYRHMGQMAQWTGLMVYEGQPGGRPF